MKILRFVVFITLINTCSTSSQYRSYSSTERVVETCTEFMSHILDVTFIREGSFESHFSSWLEKNGYEELLKEKSIWSSFGGLKPGQRINHTPTIFIHGNSDTALGYSSQKGELAKKLTGWKKFIKSYLNRGLSMGEMYGITIGDANEHLASYQVHNYENIMRIRLLIHAVSEYSKENGHSSGKVNIVAHSMGNTIGLKAILGGKAYDIEGSHGTRHMQGGMKYFKRKTLELPNGTQGSIADRVNVFVGIAGATKGLDACKGVIEILVPTCNKLMGLSPDGEIINEINEPGLSFASRTYAFYSRNDQILGTSNQENRADGVSSSLPQSDKDFVYEGEDHFEVKDNHRRKIFNLLYGKDFGKPATVQ